MIRVAHVEASPPHALHIRFSDGREGRIDLTAVVLQTGAMVEPLRDPAFFSRVRVERGVPTWPNGFDIAPGWLYREMEGSGTLSAPLAA